MIAALALHILSAIVWVGGMFFAYVILRPVAGGMEPPARLRLWREVFEKFFLWVWICALALVASGYFMALVLMGGMAAVGLYVHIMSGVGVVMVLIFMHLYFAPWRRFKAAVDSENFEQAGVALNTIRKIVHINLMLGLATAVVGATGRFWG